MHAVERGLSNAKPERDGGDDNTVNVNKDENWNFENIFCTDCKIVFLFSDFYKMRNVATNTVRLVAVGVFE